jgi:hypothetical protein
MIFGKDSRTALIKIKAPEAFLGLINTLEALP